ncbi:YfcC family protein [Mesoplasma lactucae]|uniref:C4-dicarboxylate ABC transporter n=1 Tax=Mesoplasma lactucae ATCC 49193 TaxID=81460 RepID=A0A291ISX4_9MOLU|nr:C4-dicarboxylate ABC transporter [Mesoplasma lactucae ATCC 49193]
MLSAFSIIFIVIALLVLVTWILHWAGVTADLPKREVNEKGQPLFDPLTGQPLFVPGVYESVPIQPMGILDIFFSVFKGFENQAGIIIFLLSIGAFVLIVVNSKSLDGFAQLITRKLKGNEIWAIVPLMLFFSICGTVEGFAEETLGFYMICIPLMLMAGFDVFTGLLVILLGAGSGVLASTVNPFVITTAISGLNQGAGYQFISVGDGLVWRLVCWIIMLSASICAVMLYAWRIKKNPQKSVTFDTYEADKTYFLNETEEQIDLNWRRKTTLVIFLLTFIIMIIYLISWDSILNTHAFENAGEEVNKKAPYLTALIPGFGQGELIYVAAFFLIASIILGFVNGLGEEGFIKQYMDGAADILSVCLIIGTAAGVGVILRESHMQELFVKGLAGSVGGINPIGRIIVLYLLFIPLSFVIPSSSGFATAVFPLLAGTVSVDPNAAVLQADAVAGSGSILAFSFGSGFLNLFSPTSGVVMGALGIARINYGKFLKGIWPFLLMYFVLSLALLAIGGAIGGSIA